MLSTLTLVLAKKMRNGPFLRNVSRMREKMKKIAIIGSGQSGLILALGLLEKNFQVTLVSDRSQEQIRNGSVLSSQCLFSSAIATEDRIIKQTWHDYPADVAGIELNIINPENSHEKLVHWLGKLKQPGQSVDQRMKLSSLMDIFTQRGGQLKIVKADIPLLEKLAEKHDLVILATGKGEISKKLTVNESVSHHVIPQRILSLCYVHGVKKISEHEYVTCNILPGIGEYFSMPAVTFSGPCHISFFEGIPGGAFDCWENIKTPDEHLILTKKLLTQYLPAESDRMVAAELTDRRATLIGSVTPVIREPVLTLPSGRHVLSIGDAAVLNDPITGQGANSATKAADIYLESIVAQQNLVFDRQWMESTFEKYWAYAKYVCEWTDSLLAPPTERILSIIGQAQESSVLADNIANGFDDPTTLFPWWRSSELLPA